MSPSPRRCPWFLSRERVVPSHRPDTAPIPEDLLWKLVALGDPTDPSPNGEQVERPCAKNWSSGVDWCRSVRGSYRGPVDPLPGVTEEGGVEEGDRDRHGTWDSSFPPSHC